VPPTRFEDALQRITHDFAMQVVELIRTTTLDELTVLAQPQESGAEVDTAAAPRKPARRRGRPPKAKAATSPPVKATKATGPGPGAGAPPVEKPKKRRAWPTCSVEGCGKKMYPGSGKKRLCYGHHLDAGGKQSPLLDARKGKAPAAAAGDVPTAPKATNKPKTVRRKKAAAAKG